MKGARKLGLALAVAMSWSCQSSNSQGILSGIVSPSKPEKLTSVEGITQYSLDNGMQVLLFPDQSKPTLTVNITYLVGSRHEGYGEAGMAHLLEHMVFKGTPDRPDIWKSLQDRGAQFNGTTWTDRTNYYETLPASEENLDFALSLEADRMVNSIISEEDLKKEFSVVRNEFEMQENNPGSILLQRMHSAAYLWHNYGQSTIGNRSDIEQVPVENLRAFYRKYYQPDNAILVVAGRFDAEKTLEKINDLFGKIPAPERKLPQTYTQEPIQDGERKVVLRRSGEVPMAGLLYHVVSGSHEDFVAVEAFAHLLTNNPSGRLYKQLVEGGQAASIYGTAFSWREPGSFWMMAQAAPGKSAESIKAEMIKAVEGIDPNSISAAEVERFKSQALSQVRMMFANSQAIAISLSEWAAMGDWRLMFLNRDRIEALTVEDVRRVAKKYFVAANRTEGLFVPTDSPKRAPEAKMPNVAEMVKGYKGKEALAQGEVFDPSYENIAKRTTIKTLANGSKLALLEKKTRGETVEVSMTLSYGDEKSLVPYREAESLLPSMLLRGTKSLSYQAFEDKLAKIDTRINASNDGPGKLRISVSTQKKHLAEAMNLVADVLLNPAFDNSEFETFRTQVVASIQESLVDPRSLAQTALLKATRPFDKSSIHYVYSIEESLQAMKSAKLSKLKELHANFLGANHMSVAVVGDFEQAAFEKLFQDKFSNWKAKMAVKPIVRPYKKALVKNIEIDTPDKAGAMVSVAHNLKLNIEDPSYPAIRVASFVLGGSSTSRIFDRLRQKEGLAYGAWGRISPADEGDAAGFSAGAICSPAAAKKAMGFLLEEIDRFYKDGVTTDELSRAKVAIAETNRNRMSSDANVAYLLNDNLQLDRNIMFYDKMMKEVSALELAQVNEALKTALTPDQLFQVIAADKKQAPSASL